MRFSADGSKGHCAGGKSLDYFCSRLYFVQGNRISRLKFEQPANSPKRFTLLVDDPGELLECLPLASTSGMLEQRDSFRVQLM